MTKTKTRRVLLKDWESCAFASGRKSVIVRPIVPQPPEGAKVWNRIEGDSSRFVVTRTSPHHEIRCHFGRPGDELVGCEVWARAYMDEKEYLESIESGEGSTAVYRADWAGTPSAWCGAGENWRSAATMPSWAVRHRWTVESVAAKRLGELTEEEAEAAGAYLKELRYGDVPFSRWFCGDSEVGRGDPLTAFLAAWDFKRYPVESSPWIWLVRVAPKARE